VPASFPCCGACSRRAAVARGTPTGPTPTAHPRPVVKDLLALQWIREETADRSLLYACHVPIFPVDHHVKAVCQTYRLGSPLGMENAIQELVRSAFHEDIESYRFLYAACQLESAHIRKMSRAKAR